MMCSLVRFGYCDTSNEHQMELSLKESRDRAESREIGLAISLGIITPHTHREREQRERAESRESWVNIAVLTRKEWELSWPIPLAK